MIVICLVKSPFGFIFDSASPRLRWPSGLSHSLSSAPSCLVYVAPTARIIGTHTSSSDHLLLLQMHSHDHHYTRQMPRTSQPYAHDYRAYSSATPRLRPLRLGLRVGGCLGKIARTAAGAGACTGAIRCIRGPAYSTSTSPMYEPKQPPDPVFKGGRFPLEIGLSQPNFTQKWSRQDLAANSGFWGFGKAFGSRFRGAKGAARTGRRRELRPAI